MLLDGEPGLNYNLNLLLGWISYDGSTNFKQLYETGDLLSKRHFNDIYFAKKLSFVHLLKNQSNKTLSVSIFEFFPSYLKMYTKDIKMSIYSPGGEDMDLGQEWHSYIPKGYTKKEYNDYTLNFDKGTIGLWFRFDNIILKPNQIMLLHLDVKKHMINQESQPVDSSMDANVPPLPILYHEVTDGKVAKEQIKISYSESWVIVNMEPDRSMPFNINAMFIGVIGITMHWVLTNLVDTNHIVK
jgi:hypothetical protein